MRLKQYLTLMLLICGGVNQSFAYELSDTGQPICGGYLTVRYTGNNSFFSAHDVSLRFSRNCPLDIANVSYTKAPSDLHYSDFNLNDTQIECQENGVCIYATAQADGNIRFNTRVAWSGSQIGNNYDSFLNKKTSSVFLRGPD